MHRDTSAHSLIGNRRIRQIQEYKMKTILCIFSAACCCLVILALATASPIESTTPSEDNSSTTSLPSFPVGHLANGSKLVITHVVKTLEFEVDLRDDDDNSTETESSTPFFETGIEVLNPQLLLDIVKAKYNLNENESSINGTKIAENDEEDN